MGWELGLALGPWRSGSYGLTYLLLNIYAAIGRSRCIEERSRSTWCCTSGHAHMPTAMAIRAMHDTDDQYPHRAKLNLPFHLQCMHDDSRVDH